MKENLIKVTYENLEDEELPVITTIENLDKEYDVDPASLFLANKQGIEWIRGNKYFSVALINLEKLKETKYNREFVNSWDIVTDPYYIEKEMRKRKMENL